MKDDHDKRTLELVPPVQPDGAAAVAAAIPAAGRIEGKLKRLPHQPSSKPPEGSRSLEPSLPVGWSRSVVPVSVVARDWGVSPRRVRVMLTTGRLDGRRLDNGYWEVFYPYRYIFGTRGPTLQQYRKLPEFLQEHGNE